jgi:hypothetical protein
MFISAPPKKKFGILEKWSSGVLQNWRIGELEYWGIGGFLHPIV